MAAVGEGIRGIRGAEQLPPPAAASIGVHHTLTAIMVQRYQKGEKAVEAVEAFQF